MAIYRTVSMSFWTDNKVSDDFTPEDRYFYLYLFTNPHTNLCGCYEVSIKQMANETGYSKDSIENLIGRFEKVHNVLKFCKETKEILLLNWSKYNWTSSDKFRKPLLREIEKVKNPSFRDFLMKNFDNFREEDTVSIPYAYRSDTSVTDIYINNNNSSLSFIDIYKEIISYLNMILDSNYKYTTKKTQDCIKARLNEGFTVDDFKTVIDKKAKEWLGTDMEKYLRPETLFGNKFEGYLNQTGTTKGTDKPKRQGVKWE